MAISKRFASENYVNENLEITKTEINKEINILSKEVIDQREALSDYVLKSEIPTIAVESVNGKTGIVVLDAEDVGADQAGTAEIKVNEHNISTAAHNDIRLLIEGLTIRLNALANSDDTTLDQMAEVVAYIKSNRTLIESITTDKISVADIVNNLTTNVSNKPLSAAQGVALKALIDKIVVPTLLSQLDQDSTHRLVTDAEKEAWNKKSNFSGSYNDLTNKPPIPSKVSELENDEKYLKEIPSEYITEEELEAKKYLTQHQDLTPYAKNEDLNKHKNDDTVHITQQERTAWNNKSNFSGSYNDLTNKPTIPSTPEQVGADPKGTATTQVGTHNTNTSAHNDIRLLIDGLTSRLNALANSTDEDLDQMAEVVAYIKSNRTLIESITTDKISVADIVNNLTTNVSNKPLSAAQGVVLKGLIDALQTAVNGINVPTKTSQLTNDSGFLTAVPSGYAKTADHYTKTEADNKYQPKGNYLTSIPTEYVTETELTAKGYAKQTDVNNLSKEIADLITSGVQQTPLFANSIEECTDETKVYVLPDGYIYGYTKKTEEIIVPGETVTVPAKVALLAKKRYSHSNKAFTSGEMSALTVDCMVIPFDTSGGGTRKITFTGILRPATYQPVYAGVTNTAFPGTLTQTTSSDFKTTEIDCSSAGDDYSFIVLNIQSLNGNYDGIGITIDGVACDIIVTTDPAVASHETTTTTGSTTETVVTEGFANTGHAFVPSDYEDRILALERKEAVIAENTNRIEKIEETIATVNTDLADYINSVHCPSPQLACNIDGTDFNLKTFGNFGDGFHSYFDDLVARYPHYLVKEFLGYDESGTLPMYRYVLGKHYYSAYQKNNYPRMYAWKSGSTIIYSVSVSPRIGDTMYSTKYVGTAYSTVSAVDSTNRTRTVNGLVFTRYEDGDVEPTVSLVAFDSSTIPSGHTRYPFGDLKKDHTKPIHMTIIANEHGGQTEPGIPAVVCARFIRDLCEGRYASNPIMAYLRDNVQLTIIPVVNPHGLNKFITDEWNGYHNSNNVNINRNYDTVGWQYFYDNNPGEQYRMGDYAGSENETQYVMNTMVDSKAVIAMSVHTISRAVAGTTIKQKCMYQGQNPNGGYTQDKIDKMADDMKSSYNLNFLPYNPLECPPETTSKSPSFITQIGAYGGIIEFQCHNPLGTEEEMENTDRLTNTTMFTADVMEQNYSLLLKFIAMWLSDYLDNN